MKQEENQGYNQQMASKYFDDFMQYVDVRCTQDANLQKIIDDKIIWLNSNHLTNYKTFARQLISDILLLNELGFKDIPMSFLSRFIVKKSQDSQQQNLVQDQNYLIFQDYRNQIYSLIKQFVIIDITIDTIDIKNTNMHRSMAKDFAKKRQ